MDKGQLNGEGASPIKPPDSSGETEALYKDLVELTTDIVYISDCSGNQTFMNKAAYLTLETNPDELIGKSWLQMVHPEDRERTCRTFGEMLGKGVDVFHFENRLISKSGAAIPALHNVKVLRNEDGEIVGVRGIARDISKRRQTEEALRVALAQAGEEKAKSDSIIEAMGDGVSIQDTHFRVLYQNTAHKKLAGDHIGEYCYAAYEHRDRVCEGCPVAMSFDDGLVHRTERDVDTDFGNISVEITSSPLKDAVGRVIAAVEIVRDTSLRKKMKDALLASEKTYRDLVDNSLVGIYKSNLNGDHLFANEALARILEYDSAEELRSVNVYTRYKDPGARKAFIRELREKGKLCNYEIEIVTKKGRTKKLLLSATLDGDVLSGMIMDISENGLMQAQVLQAKLEWEETFDIINDAITVHDRDFNIIRANRAAAEILGTSLDVISKRKCFTSYHGSACPPESCPSCLSLNTGVPSTTEMFEPHLGKHIEIKALPRLDKDNKIVGLVHVVKDITARKKAEEEQRQLELKLLQAQKMESVGRLAGGIAHDFNNILSAILGYSELSMFRLPEEHPVRNNLKIIRDAAEKAAALTHQLLAFSRKQVLEIKKVNLNITVEMVAKLLRRMIGEDIILELDLVASVNNVLADAGQIEQILMNLAVNARDAMPDGGRLRIGTANAELDNAYVSDHESVKPGKYVMLRVSDTGMGMSREVQKRIFEPFFTTKEMGKGTGLGLATVYGIIKQHNGYIYVYSECGTGTMFKIYLPAAAEGPEEPEGREAAPEPGGSETVLVVEDDPSLRTLISAILRQLGYRVLDAAGGEDALLLSAEFEGVIHLLLTDMIMPGMNGKKIAAEIRKQRAGIKVVLMSGYTDEVIAVDKMEDWMSFLQKPIAPRTLAKKLRDVLDGCSG